MQTLGESGELPNGTGHNVLLLAMSKVDLVLGGVWIDVSCPWEKRLEWEMNAGPGSAIVYPPWLVYVMM